MAADSSGRIALTIPLVLALVSGAAAQEPEQAEPERCECVRAEPFRERAMSFGLHYPGGAQLGVVLGSDAAAESVGASVREVVEGGPAEEAGLQPGDIITTVDGRSIVGRDANGRSSSQQLVRRMRGIEPGDTVRIGYQRAGQPQTANVIATDRTSSFPMAAFTPRSVEIDAPELWRGESLERGFRFARGSSLELAEMNEGLADYFGVDSGVLVIDVEPDSALGLEPGDVILRIGDREVRDARHARAIVSSYRDDEPVQIEIMRDGQRETITGRGR